MLGDALVLWPFLADGSFTISRRLKNGRNIFQPHRTFLIHRLAIAGVSHRRVTCVYGLLAGVGVLLAWRVVAGAPYSVSVAVAVAGAGFVLRWRWAVRREKSAS